MKNSRKVPPGCFESLFEQLLSFGSVSKETQRLRSTDYEVFKTLIDLNPNFMKEIFYLSPNLIHRKENIFVHSRNSNYTVVNLNLNYTAMFEFYCIIIIIRIIYLRLTLKK